MADNQKRSLLNPMSWFKGNNFQYNASLASTRRKQSSGTVRTADNLLSESQRSKLIVSAHDLQRNVATAAWAIRKHLDYVSTFTFQPQTGDSQLDARLTELVGWYSNRENFSLDGRFSMQRFTRLMESSRLLGGDVFCVRYRNGLLQPIEGDRVRNPRTNEFIVGDNEHWVHGMRIGANGRVRSVSVYDRGKRGGYENPRNIPSRDIFQLSYCETFDQYRGVSPLTTAMLPFKDTLEASEYALAKAKVTQLFALAIKRDGSDFDDEEGDSDDPDQAEYKISFDDGPTKLELDPGDDASFLESKHPSQEFQSFLQLTLQGALKAIDIPWSFFDESFTNFFGSRAALMQYLKSCRDKRDTLKEFLFWVMYWRISLWVARGVLVLPRGMTVTDVKFDFIPAGIPWWDPAKEIRADIEAIKSGLRTRTEIRQERYGDSWEVAVVPQLQKEKAILEDAGLAELPEDAADPEDMVEEVSE